MLSEAFDGEHQEQEDDCGPRGRRRDKPEAADKEENHQRTGESHPGDDEDAREHDSQRDIRSGVGGAVVGVD
jgi:hypothetical protein